MGKPLIHEGCGGELLASVEDHEGRVVEPEGGILACADCLVAVDPDEPTADELLVELEEVPAPEPEEG